MYIWEELNWPEFTWEQPRLSRLVGMVSRQQGRLLGRMESLGFALRTEVNLQTLTQDVIKSSEIEGEVLDTSQVRSSVAIRLGIENTIAESIDRNVDGVVEMMLDATTNYVEPLTQERLFAWQAALFPTGRSGMREQGRVMA